MRAAGALALVALSACSQPVAPAPAPSSAAAGGPPAVGSAATKSGATFDVHEWGLVDVVGPQARVLAGPPGGPTNWNAPRRKPVLYFHVDGGAKLDGLTVTVTASAPGIVEHFPAATLSDDRTMLRWSGLELRAESCKVGAVPARDAPACQTSDGICEVAELPRYETADSSCVRMGGAHFNHLFYRSAGRAPALPFDVTPKGARLAVTHARGADVVGPIIWVHNDAGTVTTSIVAPPALGATIEVDAPKDADAAPAQKALDATMRDIGLTEPEIQAFDRAWSSDLFGHGAVREAPARRAAIGPQDYVLFALPPSLVSGASELAITPAPRSVKRFMLVRLFV